MERWAKNHNMSYLIIWEHTHRAGNTLELAWTNTSGASAWVARKECVTSIYLSIFGVVPSRNLPPVRVKGHLQVTKDKLSQFAHVFSWYFTPISTLNFPVDVESQAQDQYRALANAIRIVGKYRSRRKGKSAPWWIHECKAAQ